MGSAFRRLALLLSACTALSCCNSGKPGVDNGQTGSPGGEGGGTAGSPPERPCEEHSCVGEISGYFERELGEQWLAISIVGAKCETELSVGGQIELLDNGDERYQPPIGHPICACEHDDDGAFYIGPLSVGCAVRGHAHDCVMEHGEAEPCDPTDPEACEGVCAELQARLEADARVSKPFVVRSAQCEEVELFPDYITTRCFDAVVEIDGFCYAGSFPPDWNRWQSCELSDEEILKAAAPTLPDCDDFPASVPGTADCNAACDDASVCIHAQGCDYGPEGTGFGRSGRGRCWACSGDEECLPTETCIGNRCLLRANIECEVDEDCTFDRCEEHGHSLSSRGNEMLELRCGSVQ